MIALRTPAALLGFLVLAPILLCAEESRTADALDSSAQLARLRQHYEARRAKALRPSTAWYRGELESLRAKLADVGDPEKAKKVAEEIGAQLQSAWQDDQPELARSLVTKKWRWRSEDDPAGVAVKFYADGRAEHIGMQGKWKITGPSEVTLLTVDPEQFVLRFNTSRTVFEADRRGVRGERMPFATSRGRW